MNWKTEAIEKLQKYDAMRLATINLPEQITLLEVEARNLRSATVDGTPVKGGGSKREEVMLNNLVRRQEMTLAYKQAQTWLKVTDRALSSLSPDEKLVLHRFYIYPERGCLERLCGELGVEKSAVYRKRDSALKRFTIALYGETESA